MKRCSRCREERTADTFSPLKKAKDGLHSWCKPCLAAWRREDRANKPDHYKSIERRRHENNGEKRRAHNRAIWARKSEVYRQSTKDRRMASRQIYNASRRDKFSANPELKEIRAKKNKAWREANAARVSEARRAKWAIATPTQKLRTYFGAAIAHALNGSGKGGQSWQRLVGYTAAELRVHLERQFVNGMSWDNYGKWHIDHIIPASSFKYHSPECKDFIACWALSNLRPLWASENIRKRDKRIFLI